MFASDIHVEFASRVANVRLQVIRGLQAKDSLQEVCRPMYLETFAPSWVPERLKA